MRRAIRLVVRVVFWGALTLLGWLAIIGLAWLVLVGFDWAVENTWPALVLSAMLWAAWLLLVWRGRS